MLGVVILLEIFVWNSVPTLHYKKYSNKIFMKPNLFCSIYIYIYLSWGHYWGLILWPAIKIFATYNKASDWCSCVKNKALTLYTVKQVYNYLKQLVYMIRCNTSGRVRFLWRQLQNLTALSNVAKRGLDFCFDCLAIGNEVYLRVSTVLKTW